ncbi:hypothetical protein Bca101_043851 [Brassica carinata]
MLGDCSSEIERLTKDLDELWKAKKRSEDALKSIEEAHTREVSRLEAQVSDLERDLGKSASALFKLKKEKKKNVSEVHGLQREIQKREESEVVVSSDDFRAPLARMAALFCSLLSVHERDLALANIEGSLSEIRLLKGERAPTLDSEGARQLSRKGELEISEGDFDSVISQLQSECTLTPCLGEPEGRDSVVGEGEDDGTERGEVGAKDDDMVPGSVEVEDEGGAPKST